MTDPEAMSELYAQRLEELEQRCQDLETILETTSEHADFIEAELEKRNDLIRQIFGRYVTREVVEQLLSTPDGLKIGGERRELTVLTSDLRGFTALTERLPAEDVIRILNFYLGAMAEVIIRHGGTINEFLGDGILVFFGAPSPCPDHARKALLCALAMQAAIAEVNRTLAGWNYPKLEMGIGVTTGEAVVGNVGSEQRAKYGAVGGAVNLAYRIESYTLGGDVLASAATVRAAGPGVQLLGSAQCFPKGSRGPLLIYSVGGLAEAPELTLAKTEAALSALPQPLPVRIYEVQDKDVALVARDGMLQQLSESSAELSMISPDAPPPLFSNLRLELEGVGEAYAKVTAAAASQGRFIVRLTQRSPAFEAWAAAQLSRPPP